MDVSHSLRIIIGGEDGMGRSYEKNHRRDSFFFTELRHGVLLGPTDFAKLSAFGSDDAAV